MKASDRARVHAAVDILLDVFSTPPAASPQSTSSQAPTQTPLVDKRELARQLAVSPATIDRLVRSGMPYQPVGDVRRFDIAECKAWLTDRNKASRPEPATPPASGPRAPDQRGVRLLSRTNPTGARG
jgi:hypothetical protein